MSETFEWVNRRALIIYLKQLKYVRQLRRYGVIQYVSKKMKYVVLYVNEGQVDSLQKTIRQLPGVIKVEISLRPDIKTDYNVEEK